MARRSVLRFGFGELKCATLAEGMGASRGSMRAARRPSVAITGHTRASCFKESKGDLQRDALSSGRRSAVRPLFVRSRSFHRQHRLETFPTAPRELPCAFIGQPVGPELDLLQRSIDICEARLTNGHGDRLAAGLGGVLDDSIRAGDLGNLAPAPERIGSFAPSRQRQVDTVPNTEPTA